MAVTYKDISQLTQKLSVAGTEKLPVSDTEYITPSQIAGITNVPVTDVTVGGASVVSNKVAVIPAIPTVPTISTDIAADASSDTKTASPKAVATYVGNPLESVSAPTPYDGTLIFTHLNGDTDTVDLNHSHPQYLKYYLCEDEAEYEAIVDKDATTLYLIPESE